MFKLVLIDDEYMVLQGLQKLVNWGALGFEIVGLFSDGNAAFDYVKDNEVDLVITDVTMPELNGIDFIKKCQDHDIDFYFIIISGYKDFNYVLEGLRLGAINYLTKPIDREELGRNVQQVLDKMEADRTLQSSTQTYFNHTLRDWVNNDIDKTELTKRMKNFGYEGGDNLYTAAIFDPIEMNHDEIIAMITSFNQSFYYVDEVENVVLIIDHTQETLGNFIKEIMRLNGDGFRVGMGQTVNQVEHVYISYEHALSTIELMDFYNINVSKTPFDLNDPQLSLKPFNNALVQRDINAIYESLDTIFEELEIQRASPDHVKYMTFMMFMDLKKEFEVQDDHEIDGFVSSISKASTSQALNTILKQSLESLKEANKPAIYNPNVQQVIKIIMDEYDTDLTLKYVSEQLHLNTMYLGQLFKRETGKSFAKYLNLYRIKHAQHLILTTDLNINEISEAVGYSSSGYFYKNFKLICGDSPKDFKAKFVEGTL